MIHCSFHTATRGYDHFNQLTGVNGYGYTYNARDQRTKQTLIDGQSWEYSYDELGQVISGVKKIAAGTVVVTYDYDPFGNVSATGSVSNNPWQFSSEFRDAETGLIYYNYRYYAPGIGRWISRDPIWETRQYEVSKFIYIFVYNNSINMLDSLGLLVKEVMCDCSDACIEAMEQAIDRQADTILSLLMQQKARIVCP